MLCLGAAGCALPLQSEHLADEAVGRRPVELVRVPFYPQKRYQCGPAALATVLDYSGVPVSPAALRDQVYLPARHGSLQVEMLVAARRNGRIPYVLRRRLVDLLAELDAGRPVLVLQNLGLSWYQVWHYAVVVGYDPGTREVVLRSGTERRHIETAELFERTWRRSNYWAVVLLRPGELPATAEEQRYLKAVVPLERIKAWPAAEKAYRAALKRWPKSLVALMGLGNSRYAQGDAAGAIAAFRRAVQAHPDAAVAYNNLAYVLAQTGDLGAARLAAQRAVTLGGKSHPEYEQTLAGIVARH